MNRVGVFDQRLDVIGLPRAREWHRPRMLDMVGPRAFGYDHDHVPLGRRGEH
ncbi:MAG: DUF917 family protein [Actinomycetia bacterium]|nr:DUF917 family protein [Actinomycetes bacterium]